jgi:2-amino-4-hydroxy-6-hydroxymethyldihydropteridine diphosphokinase
VVEAIIALGSNLGDRRDNLLRAIDALGRETKVLDVSSVYETEPMYNEDQGPFLNCVIAVETSKRPILLLASLKALEEKMGRERTGPRYGPRIIDLDILYYGDEVVSEPSLEIPHPRVAERAFVLVPLKEIRPTLVNPVSNETVTEMLGRLKTDKRVVKRPDLSVALA